MLCGSLGLAGCDATESSSSAEQGSSVSSKGLQYTLLENGTYEVSGLGTCTDTELVIPATYNGKAVITIGNYAFDSCDSLTSVYYKGTESDWANISIGYYNLTDATR